MEEAIKTIPQMVASQAQRLRDKTVLRVKEMNLYRDISWKELMSQVEAVALGLLDMGLKEQDRVAILSENRPEWAAADLGTLSAGGVTVPIYTTLTTEEMEHILKDSNAHFVFVSNPTLMNKILPLQDALDLKIILFDAPYRVSGPRIWWLGELIGLGMTAGPNVRQQLQERLEKGTRENLASIIYTSGTTGPPKGVMLTHDNFLSNCRAIQQAIPLTEGDQTLSFLPLSHVFERTAGYYFVLFVGGTIAYAENMDKVAVNLLEARPTIVIGVPRFYEKLHDRIQETIAKSSWLKRRIFLWAGAVGRRGRNSFEYRLADRLVFSKLRSRLGGKLRFCVSGGAPLSKELGEFFYAAGLLLLEGYGLTETSPVITANRPHRFRFGTVGLPVPGVEVNIAPDGEILTRGPHIMRGYFNNPKATAQVLDKEGWFHTGDIGTIDSEGFLTITDRKKDLIKTSGGKMVAPQNMEAALKRDPLIADCVVIGDKRKYLTALIVPNMEKLQAFAQERLLGEHDPKTLVELAQIKALVWEGVERVNKKLAPFEQLKKITLLSEPFTAAKGDLTPTLKVKRRIVAERFAAEIEAMYQD